MLAPQPRVGRHRDDQRGARARPPAAARSARGRRRAGARSRRWRTAGRSGRPRRAAPRSAPRARRAGRGAGRTRSPRCERSTPSAGPSVRKSIRLRPVPQPASRMRGEAAGWARWIERPDDAPTRPEPPVAVLHVVVLLVGPVLHRRLQSNAATATGPQVPLVFSAAGAPVHALSIRARGGAGHGRTPGALLDELADGPSGAVRGARLRGAVARHGRPGAAAGPHAVELRRALVDGALERPRSRPTSAPLGANFELADAVAVFQPFFQFTRAVLPDVPLWNPHIMAGRPVPGRRPVGGLLAVHACPRLVLPFWKSLAVMAALKLFVARVRHVPVRPGAGDALRRRAAGRAWCSPSGRSSSSGWPGR